MVKGECGESLRLACFRDADPLRKKWEEAVEEIRRVEENRTERGGLSDGVWREGAACRVSWTQD